MTPVRRIHSSPRTSSFLQRTCLTARRLSNAFSFTNGALFGRAVLAMVLTCLPLVAAEDAAADPAELPIGTVFRWLNFALVTGVIAYLVVKLGAPYFRANARAISGAIRDAAETRTAAERELREAEQRLASVNLE